MRHPVHQSGYTLVEMAIVLSIMGVVAGGVLSLGSVKHESAKMELTQQRLDKIEKAINLHARAAGYLPCPADPTTLPGDAAYGVAANCNAAAPAGIDTSGTGANEVWIGAIPNRTLNLPDTTMYDAWLNRFTYAVVKDLAKDASTFHNYSSNSPTGVIQIIDDDGTQVTDSAVDTVVAYAVLSHGKDKKGAINRSGTMPILCGAATKDDENCDGDAVFRDNRIRDSTLAANYYDDIIRWKTRHFMEPLVEVDTSTASCEGMVFMGNDHSCALKSDGTAWCWGRYVNGKLGDGSTIDRWTPVQVSGLNDATAINGGYDHSCALKSDGTVWCWGNNVWNQLGDGTTIDRWTPVQVSGLNDATAISGGTNHSCALKSDGTAWCWGYNMNGQLGDGTTIARSTPVPVSGLNDATAISGGSVHTCALKSDGTAWCWGRNSDGQLGDGTMSPQRLTPVQVIGLSDNDVIGIAGGLGHTCALKSDGTAWCWGRNSDGQLGDGTNINRMPPVQVSGLNDPPAINLGWRYSCALKSDGTAWCWGENSNGQLGDGTTIARWTPVQVSGLNDATAIFGGTNHSCALKSDGTAWCWGRNGSGKLGDGTNIDRSTPVQVSGFSACTP